MTELILLVLSGIIVAGWLEKRSSILSIAHAVCFVVFLTITLITTDIPVIAQAFENLFDADVLYFIRDAIEMPSNLASISFSAIMIIEMLSSILMIVIAAVCVVKIIKKAHKKLAISEEVIETKTFSVISFSEILSNVPIYLRYGHLLN